MPHPRKTDRALYRVTTLAITTLALLTFALPGCGKSPPANLPTTYPVTGTVTAASGKSLSSGVLQFESGDDSSITALAEIEADGSFTLATRVHETELPGTTTGTYIVTVIPPMGADQNVEPLVLPRRYVVRAEENRFEISVKDF